MEFLFKNLILLLISGFTYFYFRSGVSAYCKLSKMSKTFIRKNTKGISNFWLYTQLHKQHSLGSLYYLNFLYLIALIVFLVATAFSWIPFLKIPVIVLGIFLGITVIPAIIKALIYINLEEVGKPFVVFKVFKGYNGRSRRFATALDWLLSILPLGIYILLLTKNIFW